MEVFLSLVTEIGIFIDTFIFVVVIEHGSRAGSIGSAIIGMGVAIELLVHGAAVEFLRGDVVRIEGGEPVGEAVTEV